MYTIMFSVLFLKILLSFNYVVSTIVIILGFVSFQVSAKPELIKRQVKR